MIRLLTQSDKQIILEYIERNEIETSFLYANIAEFGVENMKDMRRCGDYYGLFDGKVLRGIIPFYNLSSCTPHYKAGKAVPLFAELMKQRKFDSLLGMHRVIKPLYEEIKVYKETESIVPMLFRCFSRVLKYKKVTIVMCERYRFQLKVVKPPMQKGVKIIPGLQ